MQERDALHARVRAMVAAYTQNQEMPEPFDALAVDLGRYQARHNPGYARLCGTRTLERAADFPAVPTDAFKVTRVATFPEEDARHIFRTSGTTVGQRGAHELRDLGSYDAGALAFGARALREGLGECDVLVLGPSAQAAPDSSLTHMLDLFARAWGKGGSPFFLHTDAGEDVFDLVGLDERIARAIVSGAQVLLLGTSFAFVHLLDTLGDDTIPLPAGSRIMQTGGFKGRSREVSAPELRAALARCFHVEPRNIVQEYGMTELSSQFYEHTAIDPSAPEGVFYEPPWARVIPVHPDTLTPVPDGEEGLARIEDLCNVESAFAIQTADRVRREHGGFVLLGRQPGSPPRGCSLAIDELLAR